MKEMNRDGEWVEPENRDRRSYGPPERNMADLLAIARYQKAIIVCILFLIADVFAVLPFPDELKIAVTAGVALVHLVAGTVAAVFVFLLALRIYTPVAGIALSICTLIPCLGLFVLVIINSKATGTLNVHGVRVGFLGVGGGEMARLKRWAAKDERDRERP